MPNPNMDVAHNGDCGFESLAASLIDLQRAGELEEAHRQQTLDELFKVYLSYFPTRPKLPTSKAIFDDLIETVPPRQLVQNLAFAIRQHAVNLIVANPAKYPGAFADKTEGTDPASMRKPGTWVDGSALTAFCDQTRIPVHVQLGRNSIPLYDGPTTCKKPIQITLNGGHYQPTVKDPGYFNEYKTTLTARPKVVAHDQTLEEINKKIQKVIQHDQQRDQEIVKKLSTLSTEKLIECYQQQMKHSDYLPNKVARVTAEHKGDLFLFNAITDNKSPGEDPRLKAVLIQALSKEIYRTNYNPDVMKNMFESEQKSEFTHVTRSRL